jgi:CDP-paratose 2-epimerase
MKILITGVCGFVGNAIARAWLDAETGLTVHGIDNLMRPGSELNRNTLIKAGVKFYQGDIRATSDFDSLPPVDWVIDAAANPSVLAGIDGKASSRQLVEHNLQGTVNTLEYCKRYGAGFMLISTSRVYSIPPLASLPVVPEGGAFRLQAGRMLPVGISEEGVSELFSTAPPISLYGSTKLASEVLALEYGETFNFPVWINRCGVLAGAGQFGKADQGIFAYWINSYLRRRSLKYIGFGGTGYQVRDCLHPRDLIPLLRKQTTAPSFPERVINLGGGKGNAMSLAELSEWCSGRFGEHAVQSDHVQRRFDIPWLVMDSSLASRIWGWKLQTSLSEILEEIARHAEENPGWLGISGAL